MIQSVSHSKEVIIEETAKLVSVLRFGQTVILLLGGRYRISNSTRVVKTYQCIGHVSKGEVRYRYLVVFSLSNKNIGQVTVDRASWSNMQG